MKRVLVLLVLLVGCKSIPSVVDGSALVDTQSNVSTGTNTVVSDATDVNVDAGNLSTEIGVLAEKDPALQKISAHAKALEVKTVKLEKDAKQLQVFVDEARAKVVELMATANKLSVNLTKKTIEAEKYKGWTRTLGSILLLLGLILVIATCSEVFRK